jgi:hypothetical protein
MSGLGVEGVLTFSRVVSARRIQRRVVRWNSADMSDEYTAFNFRAEDTSSRFSAWFIHPHPRSRLAFNELHHLISPKLDLTVATAVRTSGPAHVRISEFWRIWRKDLLSVQSRQKHEEVRWDISTHAVTQTVKRCFSLAPVLICGSFKTVFLNRRGRGPVPGTSSCKKIIYRAAVSQRLRTTALRQCQYT